MGSYGAAFWGATVLGQVHWDTDAKTEICICGFNGETHGHT